MKKLSMLELKAPYDRIQNDPSTADPVQKNELILDVRTVPEFSSGHVLGALNIPLDQVLNHAESLKKYEAVYVYCAAGMRSQTACHILSTLGLRNLICIDEGGYADWEEAGFPHGIR